jgi:hypothetical protein
MELKLEFLSQSIDNKELRIIPFFNIILFSFNLFLLGMPLFLHLKFVL